MAVGTVLVTGGTGYIGSFTSLALLNNGYEVIIVDNLYNSSEVAIDRIELLSGKRPIFYNADLTNEDSLDKIFAAHPDIDSVIHFAALKAVGESAEIPLEYYRVNVGGTIALLNAMKKHKTVTNIVFSSSATVYGDATRFPNMIPIPEHCPKGPTNTYGYTKAYVEQIITDFVTSQREGLRKALEKADKLEGDEKAREKARAKAHASFRPFNGANLRYFNPCGAQPSGLMGEDPQGQPFNLLPILGKVATNERNQLQILGDDYPSPDGTAIRDYIHVVDLADGHVAALNYLRDHKPGVTAWNLGSGKGSSVTMILEAFSEVVYRNTVPWKTTDVKKRSVVDPQGKPVKDILYCVEADKDGKPIVDKSGKPARLIPYVEDVDKHGKTVKRLPYFVDARRAGDVLDLTANPSLANKELGWATKRSVKEACEDLWFWVKNNPKGYRQEPKIPLLAALVESKKADPNTAALEIAEAALETAKAEHEKAALETVERKKAELEAAQATLEEIKVALEQL